MSDYGAMIMMENGNPFVTPNSTPFCLFRKVSANSVQNGSYHQATISVAIDSSYPVMVFCKTTVTRGGTYVSAGRSGNTVTAGSSNYLSQAHTLTAYIFAVFPQSLPAWGIAFWDAAGKLVLTNESRVLSNLVTVGTPGNNGGINIDVTLSGSYAVSPATLGGTLLQNNNTKPPSIVFVQAYTACGFNGSTTRINAASGNAGNGGSPRGYTNAGIAITAINTAAYD